MLAVVKRHRVRWSQVISSSVTVSCGRWPCSTELTCCSCSTALHRQYSCVCECADAPDRYRPRALAVVSGRDCRLINCFT